MDAESVLRVKGLGDAGKNRGVTGDLYITFAIKPRAGIVRRGLDLYSDVRLLSKAHVRLQHKGAPPRFLPLRVLGHLVSRQMAGGKRGSVPLCETSLSLSWLDSQLMVGP